MIMLLVLAMFGKIGGILYHLEISQKYDSSSLAQSLARIMV